MELPCYIEGFVSIIIIIIIMLHYWHQEKGGWIEIHSARGPVIFTAG